MEKRNNILRTLFNGQVAGLIGGAIALLFVGISMPITFFLVSLSLSIPLYLSLDNLSINKEKENNHHSPVNNEGENQSGSQYNNVPHPNHGLKNTIRKGKGDLFIK